MIIRRDKVSLFAEPQVHRGGLYLPFPDSGGFGEYVAFGYGLFNRLAAKYALIFL